MGASLKDIAKELNLSKTTVSWVLSGQARTKGISEATAKRVLKCAMRLNYHPNLIAKSLHTGQTNTIGLILPSISDDFYSGLARVIETEARRCGYSLMISSSKSDKDREEEIIHMFKAKRVDGIIIAPTKKSQTEIKRLIDESFPFVTVDRFFPELKTNYIIINNYESSYLLTKHLINKGSRKIAIITTNPHLTTMNMRREGYEKALTEFHIDIDKELIGEVMYAGYEKNIYSVLDRIFQHTPDLDAFFFTTHILALETFQYLNEKKIHRKFEMACIHDIPVFKILAPQINVARMPIEKIGLEAVTILIEQINDYKENAKIPFSKRVSRQPSKCVLPCDMIFRS